MQIGMTEIHSMEESCLSFQGLMVITSKLILKTNIKKALKRTQSTLIQCRLNQSVLKKI